MGVSSDGIVVFGIDLGEEPPEFLDGDFDDYLDSISGLPQYGEPGHSWDAINAHRKACPADVTIYCSYDYPMYILAVRDTEVRVSRGYVIDVSDLPAPDEARLAAFKAWCVERGVENPEPKWLLCSLYG